LYAIIKASNMKEVLIELKNIINALTIIGFLTMIGGVMYALWGSIHMLGAKIVVTGFLIVGVGDFLEMMTD
jgi:hypothetical protein